MVAPGAPLMVKPRMPWSSGNIGDERVTDSGVPLHSGTCQQRFDDIGSEGSDEGLNRVSARAARVSVSELGLTGSVGDVSANSRPGSGPVSTLKLTVAPATAAPPALVAVAVIVWLPPGARSAVDG